MNTTAALSWTMAALCATFVLVTAPAKVLSAPAERPDGGIPPSSELGIALAGRPDVAKPLGSLGGVVMDGSRLRPRDQFMLVAVVASRNHCLY